MKIASNTHASINCLWEAIQCCAAAVVRDTIKTLTESINNNLIKEIRAMGDYTFITNHALEPACFNAKEKFDSN